LKLAAILLGVGLAVSACSDVPPTGDVPLARSEPLPENELQEGLNITRFVGPGVVCGMSFALALQPEERFTRFDRMMDFVTYRLESPAGSAIVYEGNAPQEAEVLIKTGREFPSVVALHLDAGGYDKSLADRILIKDEIPQACAAAKSG
jgi:hypothetical protein